MTKTLLILDMQVDFVSADGAYARGGIDVSGATRLLPAIAQTMSTARHANVPILATRFTILVDLHGKPINMGHVADLRPFLVEGGFRPGTPGHQVHPDLPIPDATFDKYRFSPFYATPLPILLDGYKSTELILAGIATHGAVEACARDAVMRDYKVTVLTDLCASFNPANHEAALTNLKTMARLCESAEYPW